ncbi:MAG TPA: hypothetical protein GX392_06620 [Clostridiales bacterium]|nr:hypothetical protein [Clostridiales bacterium]
MNKNFISEKEILDYIEEYRCNGGFKMNKMDDCFDIQATYYFVDLL